MMRARRPRSSPPHPPIASRWAPPSPAVRERAIRPPPCRSSGGRRRVFAAHDRRGVEDRADDLVVARAAAQVGGEPITGLLLRRGIVLVDRWLRRCAVV